MKLQPQSRMTVDEFLAWSEHQPGRHELLNGTVFALSPQSARHVRAKTRARLHLERAIRTAGLDCEALADGMTVRVVTSTAFEPEALVQCGERIADETTEAPSPAIVVEVLSPSSRSLDTNAKLSDYFRIPSVLHYLVVDPKKPLVIHHRRDGDGIAVSILSEGSLDLDTLGLSLPITDFFAET